MSAPGPRALAPSIASMAAERIWGTQLRREHAALQRQLSDIATQRDTDLSNYKRRLEDVNQQIAALQGRLHDLECTRVEYDRRMEEQEEMIQERIETSVKEQLVARGFPADRVDTIMATPAARDDSPPAHGGLGSEDEPPPSVETAAAGVRTRGTPRLANRKSSNLGQNVVVPNPSILAAGNLRLAETPGTTSINCEASKKPFTNTVRPANSISTVAINSRKRPTISRPTNDEPPRPSPKMTRSRSNSQEVDETRRVASPPPLYAPQPLPPKLVSVKIPRLSQNRRSLKAYYESANVLHANLDIKDEAFDHAFVAAFIKGIQTKTDAEKLVNSLQQVCLTRINIDGTTEVLCWWDEILEGLQNAGMDVMEQPSHVTQMESASRIPIDAPNSGKGRRAIAGLKSSELALESEARSATSHSSARNLVPNSTDRPGRAAVEFSINAGNENTSTEKLPASSVAGQTPSIGKAKAFDLTGISKADLTNSRAGGTQG
ncbi:hypothetical protein BUE80_DR006256, partial [Diplocarpon rosae]